MKKLIIIITALLIALNTFIGLILSGYEPFNYLLANLSIFLSAVVIYFSAHIKIADGFKIGLSSLFIFTGIARLVCLALAPEVLEDNVFLIVAVAILLFEILCLSASVVVSKKN